MNASELRRYSRHLLIPEVGVVGQERLSAARVLCIGAGGLGSPVLAYLAAAGVGRIGIVDDDIVETSNLQRQILYATSDIGRAKVDVARERLTNLNPHIAVDAYRVRLDATNARELVRPYDIVVDGSDSFETRYLVNDACVFEQRANVFASIFRFQAQITVFAAGGTPCYRCLYPTPPPFGAVPSCAEGGVLGAIAGIAGMWQATETLKLVLGIGKSLTARLLLVDALAGAHRELALSADPLCAVCSAAATRSDVEEDPHEEFVPARDANGEDIDAAEFFAVLDSGVILLDVREPHEAALGIHPGSLHIPFSRLDESLHELDLNATYLVACRLGQRSLPAVSRLQDAGVKRVLHLRGGLLAVEALAESMYLF